MVAAADGVAVGDDQAQTHPDGCLGDTHARSDVVPLAIFENSGGFVPDGRAAVDGIESVAG